MKMHPAPVEEKKTTMKPANDPVHPFVEAFANIGSIMGRDLGVIALRSIEAQRGNPGAICLWVGDKIPDVLVLKCTAEMQKRLFAAMLIPVGGNVPPFAFTDKEVEAATVTIADGSQLVVFLEKAAS